MKTLSKLTETNLFQLFKKLQSEINYFKNERCDEKK